MKSSTIFQYLLCAALATNLVSEAFTPSPSIGVSLSNAAFSPTVLSAKKSRRRRKIEAEKEELPEFDMDEDDISLPDFDLGEEDEPVKPAVTKGPAPTTELNFDEITDVMMGDASTPTASIDDLISDRSLESKFEFDEAMVDKSIPDFTDFARPDDQEPMVIGKKKARQARRKAAAIAKLEEEEESKLNIPFITGEDGEISAIKVLEAGAWAGIFLLVGWELYLNSPLFSRAGPLAPVVFENP